tara:strand:- start:1130 stop:2050 length:921 start_codon:yes stop_codon:yes gene_type:complete
MKEILNKISENKIFKLSPIVLLHIGAKGSDFKEWKNIAKVSILLAVDANKQKIKNYNFLKVMNFDKIISNKRGNYDFNITKSEDCSSLLEPNYKTHSKWIISERFKIKKKMKVKTITVNDLLKETGINYIDWIVLDTQGMDLKILKSLNRNTINNLSIANIEPSFFEFYKNETSFVDVFKFMEKRFQVGEITFGKSFNVSKKTFSKLDEIILKKFNKSSKIYSNIIFLNKNLANERKILIRAIYLILNKKYYEAREILSPSNIKDKIKIINLINKKIFLHKIIFCLLLPYYLIRKFFYKAIKILDD